MRSAATVSLMMCLCLVYPAVGAESPLVVEIWPGEAPDETGDIGAEKSRMSSPSPDSRRVEVTEPTRLITNVTKPTLTIYRPAKERDTGTAMLICPEGGYWDLYWQLEGEEVAAWLNSLGMTGIILAGDLKIPDGAPPVFLAHGGEDPVSSPEHSVFMYLALKRAGVPAELHIYASAIHDFGVRKTDHPYSAWTDSCAKWLAHQGLLGPPAQP